MAGVALSDIYLRFAWQAWRLETSTFVLHGRSRTCSHPLSFCMAGVAGVALTHIHFRFAWLVWQVWHLVTFTFVLRGRRGASLIVLVLGRHTPSFTHHLCHTQLSHTIFVTHHLCHAPSFAHNFVTHTIFHTLSFTVLVSCSSALVVLAQAEIANNKPACSSIVSPVEVAVA